jgi:hypothetical protein
MVDTQVLSESRPAEEFESVKVSSFICDAFKALNASEIRYAVPRNWSGLPHKVGKDLDILVPEAELWQAVRIIRSEAARMGFASVVLREDGQGLGIDIIQLDGSASSIAVSFDLRTFLSFRATQGQARGLSFKVFAERLQRRMENANGCDIRILSPLDEFICLFFQYQAKRNLRIEHKIQEYAERLGQLIELPEVASWLVEPDKGAVRLDEIRSRVFSADDWTAFGATLLRRRWGSHSTLRLLTNQLRAAFIRIRFLWPQVAPLIYFSGPDGAGKTTLTEGVKERLRGCGMQFMYVYSLKLVLRGITKRLAFIKRIGRGKSARQKYLEADGVPDILFLTEDTRDRDTGSSFWRFRKRTALLVGLVDIWLGWWIALPTRLRGRFVLVETSPYDLFIKYHMPEFANIERIFGPLLPRPTIGFLLQADPQKIVERKAELTVEEIQDYYTRFDRVLQRCHAQSCYQILRTDTGPNATASMAFCMATALAA